MRQPNVNQTSTNVNRAPRPGVNHRGGDPFFFFEEGVPRRLTLRELRLTGGWMGTKRRLRFLGSVPRDGVPLVRLAGGWWVYDRPAMAGAGWRNLKLIREGKHEKGNYWLGWSVAEGRLSRSRDYQLLAEHHPEVVADLAAALGRVTEWPVAKEVA